MVKLQQIEDFGPVAGGAGSAECVKKCRTVVLIKIEMDVCGSSMKGRDSLSPELVEYLTLAH